MGSNVLDMTGRRCKLCGKGFHAKSTTFRITRREGMHICHYIVCPKCHNEEHERGE